MTSAPNIGVFLNGDVPDMRSTGITQYRRLTSRHLDRRADWFVVTTAVDLPEVAEVVTRANQQKKLRGLLIAQDRDSRFGPTLLHRAGLRTLVHTMFHHDPSVFRRILEAWVAGAQDRLIADATVQDGWLFVRSCALELLEVPSNALLLRRIEDQDLPDLEVDEDGSFLYWHRADVHLDLDAIRAEVDPEHRMRVRAEALVRDEALGSAIRTLREKAELSQRAVAGLSTRQVGRIERGEARPRLETLRVLAESHGMPLAEYLSALAAEARRSSA